MPVAHLTLLGTKWERPCAASAHVALASALSLIPRPRTWPRRGVL